MSGDRKVSRWMKGLGLLIGLLGCVFMLGSLGLLLQARQQASLYALIGRYIFADQILSDGSDLYREAVPDHIRVVLPGQEEEVFTGWDKLAGMNQEVVGWISLQTGAEYPILQGKDNAYYLDHDIYGFSNSLGAIFMHYANNPDFSDVHTIIYGHNTVDGSMFGDNDRYLEPAFWEKHPDFTIFTREAKRTYRIWNVMKVEDAGEAYTRLFPEDAVFETYVRDMEKLNRLETDQVPQVGDQLVSLSTCCDHATRRLVIQGILTETEYKNEGF